MPNFTGKNYKSVYTKSIAISPEDMKYIENTRGRKSKAGRLNEIITKFKTLKN